MAKVIASSKKAADKSKLDKSAKIKELKFEIKSNQDSIKRLFEFAAGIRKIKTQSNSAVLRAPRTEDDDRRMLKLVAYLREKIISLEKELAVLRKS